MTFFTPRWTPDASREDQTGGWAAYSKGQREVLPDPTPRRLVTDLPLAQTPKATIVVRTVEVLDNALRIVVRSSLPTIRGGAALRDLLDEIRDKTNETEPGSGLLVGVELADGTALRTYPTGPGDLPLRLIERGGGASGENDAPSVVDQELELRLIPNDAFRVVCSFAAVGVIDASVTVASPE